MAFKGAAASGVGSSRKRALEIGTKPSGFEGGIDYVPDAGVPATEPQKGAYNDRAMAAQPKVGLHGADVKPFAVKGNPY